MEILIIGVILVALMAYASTKIKNAAKQAYEQETVTGEHFTIIKPEQFIIPVKDVTEFEFECYSKDFAEDEAEKFNQCWAVIKVRDGIIKKETETFEFDKIEDGVTIKTFCKVLPDAPMNKSFELEIFLLPEYQEKYSEGINLMLRSFALR